MHMKHVISVCYGALVEKQWPKGINFLGTDSSTIYKNNAWTRVPDRCNRESKTGHLLT